MKFTKESELFLNFLIDDFDKYPQNKIKQGQADDFFRKFFNDIYISNVIEKANFTKEMLTTKDLHTPSLALSSYIPPEIKHIIKMTKGNVIKYKSILSIFKFDKNGVKQQYDHHITIFFVLYNIEESEDILKFDHYCNLMLTWLRMAFKYSNNTCSKELTIYIYMSDQKKILPPTPIQILSPTNCNSAVTYGCSKKGQIVVFRKEEWFKVFIHETFHSLGLDFGFFKTQQFEKAFKEIYLINIEFNIFEAYTEFWATILNCVFCAYNILEDKNDFDTFVLYCKFCIQVEQMFSLVQCVKILNFMGVQYECLYKKDSISQSVRKYLYKEKTNVFFLLYTEMFIVV